MQNILIVGCGTIGSTLAYLLSLKSLEDNSIRTIGLVDRDCIEEKNFPYVFENSIEFVGIPKVRALSLIISKINPKLNINEYNTIWDNDIDWNGIAVDSRDTPDEHEFFDYKLSIDWKYGVIISNNITINSSKVSRYTIKNSRFFSIPLCIKCITLIEMLEHTKPRQIKMMIGDEEEIFNVPDNKTK